MRVKKKVGYKIQPMHVRGRQAIHAEGGVPARGAARNADSGPEVPGYHQAPRGEFVAPETCCATDHGPRTFYYSFPSRENERSMVKDRVARAFST
jgi:hypothetical protein